MTVEPGAQDVRYSEELVLGLLRPAVELQPGDRPPAPGALALVQAFVNTSWDLEHGNVEIFTSPPALARWLSDHGLLERGIRLGPNDLDRALDVRAGLRSMLFFNNGDQEDRDAVKQLNRALGGRGLYIELDASGRPEFKAARRDLDAALATIATIVALAQLDGRWSHLKACRGEECGWTFYDHSRNQAGSWCAMSICGSRAKARDYRHRQKRT
ncbi:MAG TPA: CGNR zinc finger domain-containing protein [Solirubrobacteraceae bacterium]